MVLHAAARHLPVVVGVVRQARVGVGGDAQAQPAALALQSDALDGEVGVGCAGEGGGEVQVG